MSKVHIRGELTSKQAKRRVHCEGLENRQLMSAVSQALAHPLDVAYPLAGTLADGTVSPEAMNPSQFRAAYGFDKIKLNGVTGDGTGQTIAIITANDDPSLVSSTASNFDDSDLHIFDQTLGLPDPPSFVKIKQSSSVTPDVGWAEESALDVEWAHAIAPQAKIVLFEADGAGATQLFDWGVQSAAAYPGVSVVSMSFGFSEFSGETSYDSVFSTPSNHNGVSFVASTGDMGAPAEYPAFSPSVVAVGGTHLTLSGSNYGSETGYGNSGGGISSYESKPSYQSSVKQSSTMRTAPDVSIDGDPNTGVDVYDSCNGGYSNKWYRIAGTSLSAPAWAGLIAIADQGRVNAGMNTLRGAADTLPKIYSLSSSDFHDITSGDNGYSAGSGYDLVTGRGTPIANLLVPDLAGVPSGSTSTGTASISGEVYLDANNDGKLNKGDSPFSGVKVYLDTDNNGVLDSGEVSITTGSTGTFTFSNLPAGIYHLREVLPSPTYWYRQTSATVYNVTLTTAQKVSGDNFGDYKYPPGSISGYVYLDKNSDKKYDSGDTALSGVKVYIDANNDGKYDSGDYATTTNSSGYFYFGNLPPGVYHIGEVLPTGYRHFNNPSTGLLTITVTAGASMTNEDFGDLK